MSTFKEKAREWWHIEVGTVLILTGVDIVRPSSFADAILSYLNKRYQLGLSLNPPMWIGCGLIFVGLVVVIFGEITRNKQSPRIPFIAFRHHSLETFVTPLVQEDLPASFKGQEIREIECDQSSYFSNGRCDVIGALQIQLARLEELRATRNTFQQLAVGYYGLAHIPLQFHAGCSLSTHSHLLLFDLDRRTNKWRSLHTKGPALQVTVNKFEEPSDPQAVVIRISISFEISKEDMLEVVPEPFEDIRIGLATPRIDAITSYDQIGQICDKFRTVLDDVHARI